MGIAQERRTGERPPRPSGNPIVDAARKRQFRHIEEHKAPRRMTLASDVHLLWESETTIDHQVAEMLWQLEDPESRASIRAEYDVLVPTPDRPIATISIDTAELAPYDGLAGATTLYDGRHIVPATILGDHGTSLAVTYMAFPLPDRFDAHRARLRIDHPRVQCDQAVPIEAFRT